MNLINRSVAVASVLSLAISCYLLFAAIQPHPPTPEVEEILVEEKSKKTYSLDEIKARALQECVAEGKTFEVCTILVTKARAVKRID